MKSLHGTMPQHATEVPAESAERRTEPHADARTREERRFTRRIDCAPRNDGARAPAMHGRGVRRG